MNCTSDDLSRRSQTFLTSWSFITSRILQELTLKGSPTFGKDDTIRVTKISSCEKDMFSAFDY